MTVNQIRGLVAGLAIICAIGVGLQPPEAQVVRFHATQLARQAASDTPITYSSIEFEGPKLCQKSVESVWKRTTDGASLKVTCKHKDGEFQLAIQDRETVTRSLPSGWSLMPPLLAILLAMVFRKVIPALAIAILAAAFSAADGSPVNAVKITGELVWPAISSPFNLSIYAFTVFLIGMVGIQLRSGGLDGLIDLLAKRAKGRRSAQGITAAMGLTVFFDDYANSVVVGASARPLTDRFKISREKLAYLVDCTAAPVSGIALISTWIGFEIMLFNEQREMLDMLGSGGYQVFFAVLPFRFYCILSLVMVALVAFTGRDFGAMFKAEQRAIQTGQLYAPGANPMASDELTALSASQETPRRWYNGLLPILAVLFGVVGGYALAGAKLTEQSVQLSSMVWWQTSFSAVGDAMDGNLGVYILLAAAVLGSAVAGALAIAQGLLTISATATAWWKAVRAVLPTLIILALAISIRTAVEAVHADWFLASLIGPTEPLLLPIAVFLLAAATAFSTGTSWGTMSILMPVVIPLVFDQVQGVETASAALIMALCLSAVLDGAIFGDHCSPISDTTVMSSMASACDHIDHVRTQLPYAVVVMIVSATAGYILVGATGLSALYGYITGALILLSWLYLVGRRPT